MDGLREYLDLQNKRPNLFQNDGAIIKIITDINILKEWEIKEKERLQKKGDPIEWAKIGIVFDNPYYLIIRDLVEFPNGAQGGYLRLLYKSDFQKSAGVAILPIFHGNIVVNIQYRHAPRKWGFEITRGWGEPNELPIDAAEREILEEIGGEIDKIIDLGPYYPNTGVEGSEVKLFLAFMKDIGKTQLEEGIERYELLSIEKIKEMITQGKITDGFTIAAFARAFFKMLI